MVGHCVWILIALSIANGGAALAQQAQGINLAVPEIAALEPELESLYRDLHEHPELAFHEQRTAATLADRLKALGFEVTTQVGGTGLVAICATDPVRSSCCARNLTHYLLRRRPGFLLQAKRRDSILKEKWSRSRTHVATTCT